MHTYIYIHTHEFNHIYIYIHINTHTNIYTITHIHICAYLHMCKEKKTRPSGCMCGPLARPLNSQLYTHVDIYTYACTHTNMYT